MRLPDLRFSPWTILIVGLLAADLFALWVWAAWPPRVYSYWLGLVGYPGEAPIPRLITWAGWESGPRTPSGLVYLFTTGELCFVSVVLLVLCLLIVILVGKRRSEGRLWRRLSAPLNRVKAVAVRFRVRTALLGIAILGLYLGWEIHAWRTWQKRSFYLEQASLATKEQISHQTNFDVLRKELDKLAARAALLVEEQSDPAAGYYRSKAAIAGERAALNERWEREVAQLRATIAVYAARKREYELAAANPWKAMAPEPPLPEPVHGVDYWLRERDYQRALAAYDDLARVHPDYVEAHSEAAWIRATCPESQYRDGKLAVASATHACELTSWRDANTLGILAAAYAEAGDFAEAVKFQQKVVAMSGQSTSAKESRDRLATYRAGRAFRSK